MEEETITSLSEVGNSKPAAKKAAPKEKTILFHVAEDGFTAAGQVWVRGQELEYVVGSPEYQDTLDKDGNSWLDLVGDDAAQMQRWGKVMLRPGPWPGATFEDEAAAAAEKKRARKPPRLTDKI